MSSSNSGSQSSRNDLLIKISNESDDIKKANLMRRLSFQMFQLSRKVGKGSAHSSLQKELEEYIEFVENSESISKLRRNDLLASSKSQWKSSLPDLKEYFEQRRNRENGHNSQNKPNKEVLKPPDGFTDQNLVDSPQGCRNVEIPAQNVEKSRREFFKPAKNIFSPTRKDGEAINKQTRLEKELAPVENKSNGGSACTKWNLSSLNKKKENEIDGIVKYPNNGIASAAKCTPPKVSKFTFHDPSRTKTSQTSLNSFFHREPTVSALPNFHKTSKATPLSTKPNITIQTNPNNSSFINKRKFQDEFAENNDVPMFKYSNQNATRVSQGQYNQPSKPSTDFRTGLEELEIRYDKKYGGPPRQAVSNGVADRRQEPPLMAYGATKKSLGARRTVQNKFIPPIPQQERNTASKRSSESSPCSSGPNSQDHDEDDPRLKHIDPKMIELIRSEIMHQFSTIGWEDIAGLEYAKSIIKEAVVWPILRPDIFTGLRRPPRGILLFGPPGTGKTLIGKCIASQSNSTFFSISASSLTSKYVGDGEKMVRALFAVAAAHQPAVVFIDEIDSLLCQRSEYEHESSRRLKTEFLVQLDGASTAENERILIVGATNRPQELDEAARRRLVKRLYIPLPELEARVQILNNLLKTERTEITSNEIKRVGELTEGFSGADMKTLCHEASMGPIRSISDTQMNHVDIADVRPVNYCDFQAALDSVRASVSSNDLKHYIEWDKTYGSGAGKAR